MDEAPARAGRREWIGLAVIALPCLLYSMDLTVLYLAVPSLTEDLAPTSAELLWITDIYGFLLAGLLITMGTLGDRVGRRRLLLIGAAAFTATSVLAAFATSVEMLIVARALMGVCAATLAPSTLSLIRNMFPDADQRRFAIGVWATSFSVGAAIGPLAGGVLLEFFWWGSVFLLAVPVMLALLVVGPRLLPEFRDPDAGRLDPVSAGMSIAAILLVIYALKAMAERGVSATAAGALVAGLLVGTAFARRQAGLREPLIDLGLLRRPRFATALAANGISLAVAFGISLFVAQYLQLVLGFSPLEAGLWTLPESGGFIVGSMLASAAAGRWGSGATMGVGLLVAAAGLAVLGAVGMADDLTVIVVGSVVLGIGVAPVVTLGTDLIVGTAPPERAGAASGVSETSSELGGALGIAALGSIGVAVYRDEVGDGLPAGVPAGDGEDARNTLAGAVEAAAGLPHRLGADVLDAGRDAFTQSMQAAAGAGVVASVATAALVLAVLRRPAPDGPG